ncbi:MAG: hypothetical protein KAV87_14660, partial [Desulfobacteraceae bacterium]|nr:hypothetical protein [Desulfobacteraceae bacterium]
MVVTLQRLSHWFWLNRLGPLATLLKFAVRAVFSCHLPPELVLHKSVKLGHNALGVILNKRSVIGENCFIGSHVILGGQPSSDGAP